MNRRTAVTLQKEPGAEAPVRGPSAWGQPGAVARAVACAGARAVPEL